MRRAYKLLIIEDNEELRTLFGGFFERKHYDTVFAANGMEGLELLENKEHRFDLVITDIVLPHISGLGIISILKKKYPDIPVIAITGWGEQPLSLASEVKADRVMAKPFELKTLENQIIDLILQKHSELDSQAL